MCAERNAWLVVDNTYDAFVYGVAHSLVEGPHVVNVFSFSKAYGLMGWRVGYVAHPPALGPALLKAQDTVAICASQASQRVALAALEGGDAYVADKDWVDAVETRAAKRKELTCDATGATLDLAKFALLSCCGHAGTPARTRLRPHWDGGLPKG